jgi:predicted alpha-1,6-mannanase (GH76 family)
MEEFFNTVGESSRTCCQLVQVGLNTELTLRKLTAYTARSYPKLNSPTVSLTGKNWDGEGVL